MGDAIYCIQEIKQQELTTLLKYNGERKMKCAVWGLGKEIIQDAASY